MEIEQLYEVAAKELYVNAPRKGLYAQAFSEALGDPTKAQAIYMRLRVEQIQAQIEQREAADRHKAEEAKHQHERAEWQQRLAANPRPSDYVAALEEEGFAVEEIYDGCWAIKKRARIPTVHVYGIDRLRETTCLLLGKEWTTALERVQARLIDRAPIGDAGGAGSREAPRTREQPQSGPPAAGGRMPESTLSEHAAAASERGFVSRLMTGGFGLAKTYWLFGWLGSVISYYGSHVISYLFPLAAAIAILGLVAVPYHVLVSIGIWNAAGKYAGPLIWAVLARTAVVFGALFTLVALVGVARLLNAKFPPGA